MTDHLEISKERWDMEYKTGVWDYLGNSEEAPRYAVIAGYIHHYFKSGTIIDLGCGQGELWNHLLDKERESYLGYDISEEAIRRANSTKEGRFKVGNINELNFKEKAKIIVVNEVIYYIPNPLEVIKKLMDKIANDGLIIISIYYYPDKNNETYKIVNDIIYGMERSTEYFISEKVTLTCNSEWERTWIVYTIKKREKI